MTRNEQQTDLKELTKSNAQIAYARLYLFQDAERKKMFFAVDNVWVNGNNRNLINHMLEQINEISAYFSIPFLDYAITKEYLDKNPSAANVHVDSSNFYKVGRIPLIERYFHMRTNFADGVFCITPNLLSSMSRNN